MLTAMLSYWYVGAIVLGLLCYKLFFRLLGIVIIPPSRIGIVVKKFALVGKRTLPDGKLFALEGEAGIQANTLAPGLHFGYWPWQYSISVSSLTEIPEKTIGVVNAKDGLPLTGGRILACKVDCDMFQDAAAFLRNGGERGTQSAVIPPGVYRINTALFSVSQYDALNIPNDSVGIVTTREGKALQEGDIAGSVIPGHKMFQDANAFIANGGYKGRQEQVLLAGRYFINPSFASVDIVDMTEVPIAHAGVVISYVGQAGTDVSGEGFQHGNLVTKGQRGVWAEPLDPGMYPINPYTHRVVNVPTANIVLNWADAKTESHKLDANLSTITVRSSDGFKFNLDVSQIIHIPRNDASMVIARFGSISNLVTQVLEPTIGNYFRNAAQGKDVIAFIKEREQRQNEAKVSISTVLKDYNVNAVDTLIGDIVPPGDLMQTLTDRKLAEQRQITFQTQKLAEDTRKEFEQARAIAETQARVVDAERKVQIAEFDAQSSIRKAEGDAKSKTLNAEADAQVLRTVGEAEGTKILAVGTAEAEVLQKKTAAIGPERFALIEVGKALASSGSPLVPQISANGANGLVDILLTKFLKQ